MIAVALVLASEIFLAEGCSVYMEATRPTPVDLSQFDVGQTRDSVLESLGSPQSTVTESDGASCDIYDLYTKGYGAGGKIPIAVAEGAADFFTLGLAEIVLTPTEGVTKNEKHPVTFCYKDQKVVRIITTPGQTQTAAIPQTQSAPVQSVPAPSPVTAPAVQPSPVAQASPAIGPIPQTAASPALAAKSSVAELPVARSADPQAATAAPTISAQPSTTN